MTVTAPIPVVAHLFTRIDGELRMIFPITKASRENPFVTAHTRSGDTVRVHANDIIRDY